MMKRSFFPFLFSLVSMCVVSPTVVTAEVVSCADHSIAASAIRTTGDVKAFVQCAYEYVQEEGFDEARRAFNEDERWRSGPIYVFVSESTPTSDQARRFVFPPDRLNEGTSLGLLIDAYGNDYYKEQHRITSSVGDGWIYYSFTNFETGRDEPKVTYIKSIDWDGTPAAIGAGIYRRDIPGACNSEEVNAMLLDSDPSNERLMEFVRCAAMELEMKGYFAINTLTTEPRWKHGSIYLFAIDTYGYTLFSGDSYSQPDIMSELAGTVTDHDLVSVADAFGETFLYYSSRNPSTEMMQQKVTFVKRIVSFGLPILIGAGYYLEEGQ